MSCPSPGIKSLWYTFSRYFFQIQSIWDTINNILQLLFQHSQFLNYRKKSEDPDSDVLNLDHSQKDHVTSLPSNSWQQPSKACCAANQYGFPSPFSLLLSYPTYLVIFLIYISNISFPIDLSWLPASYFNWANRRNQEITRLSFHHQTPASVPIPVTINTVHYPI